MKKTKNKNIKNTLLDLLDYAKREKKNALNVLPLITTTK